MPDRTRNVPIMLIEKATTPSITVHARVTGGMQPGVVVLESIWPNADFIGGKGVNTLTSDDPAPPLGGAVFHDTAVWIKAAAAELAVAAE